MSISSLLFRGLTKGRWVWNDETNELQFIRLIPEKKVRKKKEIALPTAINGLTYAALKTNIKFKQDVPEKDLFDFRKYLRDRNKNRLDCIVTIQDVKVVAIFLCSERLPSVFHKFYNLWKVNQLLRACIVYMQFYLKTCESVIKTQHLLKAKPESGSKTTYDAMKEDLEDLRVLIGRFYAGIILGELGMGVCSSITRTEEILLFEYFLRVSAVVVWIALERKYFSVIKVELGRIFRTSYFNNFDKHSDQSLLQSIHRKERHVMIGKIGDLKPEEKAPDRLRAKCPLVHNFLLMDEPKLILVGRKDFDVLRDARLKFLTKYIFEPEADIRDHGVTIGILGFHRRLFDCLLFPCSKRTLKLLVSGSPMDITVDRKKLRDVAMEISMREVEPDTPHIFDHLPTIPRPDTIIAEKEEEPEDEVDEDLDTNGEEVFSWGEYEDIVGNSAEGEEVEEGDAND